MLLTSRHIASCFNLKQTFLTCNMSPYSETFNWLGAAQCILDAIDFLPFEKKGIPFTSFLSFCGKKLKKYVHLFVA